jgi:ribosomal protein S18 acetylase RimI-like enzyme
MNLLDARVWTAHGDAWQAEGRLRSRAGGGAEEWPGVRLMSSGLPYPQWNNADVTDARRFPLERVRAWYAGRAHGAGVPWGVCVPAGWPFPHGRRLFRKRCMALLPGRFRPAPPVAGVEIRLAGAADAALVASIDARAFGQEFEPSLAWTTPHLGAAGFSAALAALDGAPVAIGTAILTNATAGPCVGLFGIGVVERARRRGIGALVTSRLLARAFDRGVAFAHLNPTDDAAARLYGRLGFVETAGLDVYVEL